jgi:hypothetical protein
MRAWCSSRTSSPASRSAPTAARRRRRNACARAANITTWITSATPRGITPFSRCSATFRSATTSRTSQSSALGIFAPRCSRCRRTSCSSPSITPTTRRSVSGKRSRGCPSRGSSASRPPIISGRWATPGRAARAPKSSSTRATSCRADRPEARTKTATGFSNSGISYSCNTSRSGPTSGSICHARRSTPGWGSSESRRSCRAFIQTTIRTCSRR